MAIKERYVFEDFRPVHKGEPGYGKRWYISPSTGETLSYRGYREKAHKEFIDIPTKKEQTIARQAVKAGISGERGTKYISNKVKEIREKGAGNKTYQHYVDVYQAKINKDLREGGLTGYTRQEIMRSKHFKQWYKDLRSKDLKAHGRKARALEFMQWREYDADYDVGETP